MHGTQSAPSQVVGLQIQTAAHFGLSTEAKIKHSINFMLKLKKAIRIWPQTKHPQQYISPRRERTNLK